MAQGTIAPYTSLIPHHGFLNQRASVVLPKVPYPVPTEEKTPHYKTFEAKQLDVLIQTDALLDNPQFDPTHAAAAAGKASAIISTLVALPVTAGMAYLNERNPGRALSHLPFIDKHQASYPKVTNRLVHYLSRTAYGTGAAALLNGVVFAPLVAYIMTGDARTRLTNIRRHLKHEYTDYQPDFIDQHFSHIKQVKDPVAEFNDVRKQLTDPATATNNAYQTAVAVKLLTVGTKVLGTIMLAGGIQFYKHFNEFKQVRQAYENTGTHTLHYFPMEQPPGVYHNYKGQVLQKDTNTYPAKYFQTLEKSQALLQAAVSRPTLINRIHYSLEWVQYSSLLLGLKKLGEHVMNPIVLGCFVLAPATVGLGMAPYYKNSVGIEPYNPQKPSGSHWQKYLHGLKVVIKRESTPDNVASGKSNARNPASPQGNELIPGQPFKP